MIRAAELARAFEDIVGTPYVLGKSDPPRECDCSGAFVWAYRKNNLSIAHGSNSIFRNHCGATGRIDGDASRLRVGMAVLKHRSDGGEPAKYQGDGHGNMYHIGLVTSTGPLRIVHATPPVAKVDTTLGSWTHYGWLDDVDYSGEMGAAPVPEMAEEEYLQEEAAPQVAASPSRYFAAVFSANGKPVKMREKPSANCALYKELPVGEVVAVIGQEVAEGRTWSRVERNSRKWYISSEFLRKV